MSQPMARSRVGFTGQQRTFHGTARFTESAKER